MKGRIKIRVRNLETGRIMMTGKDFLRLQPAPFISDSGKYYPDGIWVEDNGRPLSLRAQEIIKNAQ